jgi:hypothetical protein
MANLSTSEAELLRALGMHGGWFPRQRGARGLRFLLRGDMKHNPAEHSIMVLSAIRTF